MNLLIERGIHFGITSGTLTTLGLMIGLYTGTSSKIAVIGGILIIAVADALSDAIGIHISEESNKKVKRKEIWKSTFIAFLFKFLFALSFVIPIALFSLKTGIIIGTIWGLLLMCFMSYHIARERSESLIKSLAFHLGITMVVVVLTYFIGEGIALIFK